MCCHPCEVGEQSLYLSITEHIERSIANLLCIQICYLLNKPPTRSHMVCCIEDWLIHIKFSILLVHTVQSYSGPLTQRTLRNRTCIRGDARKKTLTSPPYSTNLQVEINTTCQTAWNVYEAQVISKRVICSFRKRKKCSYFPSIYEKLTGRNIYYLSHWMKCIERTQSQFDACTCVAGVFDNILCKENDFISLIQEDQRQ